MTHAADAVEINWLEGSEPDLTDHEKTLVRNAYAEGYADGERHGYKIGGQEALHAATTLSTLMGDARWQRAIETLRYFENLSD